MRPNFRIHDVSCFPLVRLRNASVRAGYAVNWALEMERLLAGNEPFVLINPPGHPEETHEDFKTRGLWLKRNKEALAQLCCGLIGIEPDTEKRTAMQHRSEAATRAFGITQRWVVDEQEAEAAARLLLRSAIREINQ
ncbi:hypothetical protein [Pseudomonas sp.]|uniref:hypothetical protein n=1 Tax=Pseudomonas sp. TaxID=306 RepID=UPI0028AB6B6A|nr:hypothetical protein [Pseudomonas sp.]